MARLGWIAPKNKLAEFPEKQQLCRCAELVRLTRRFWVGTGRRVDARGIELRARGGHLPDARMAGRLSFWKARADAAERYDRFKTRRLPRRNPVLQPAGLKLERFGTTRRAFQLKPSLAAR